MNRQKIRFLIPLAIVIAVGVCFALRFEVGNASVFGWQEIALLCPVGALLSMASSHALALHAILSLILFVVVALVAGRVFCGWACPVPVLRGLSSLFRRESGRAEAHVRKGAQTALTERERKLIKESMGGCAEAHKTFDSRHIVLGGGILSALVFGFPVVCLVCPVGLTFATVFLLVRAFGFGDASWGLLLAPAFLLLEVVLFRKWCHWLCPIAALTSLVAKRNKTLLPVANANTCLERANAGSCERCYAVCPEGINPRHPERGNGMNECIRCMACVDACPSGALKLGTLASRSAASAKGRELESES